MEIPAAASPQGCHEAVANKAGWPKRNIGNVEFGGEKRSAWEDRDAHD